MTPAAAAVRELGEETGLLLYPEDGVTWQVMPARYVPDPRASDEAWMVTTVALADLGRYEHWKVLPTLTAADDARRARWVLARTYQAVVEHLEGVYGGVIFPAHRDLLRDALEAIR